MQGEDHLANGKTVAQILLGRRVETGNNAITYPIQAVVQAERGRWRVRGYKVNGVKLLKFMPYITEFALPNQLALDSSHILSTDNANVRAEVEKVVDGGTVHPPTPQPERFPTTVQSEEEGSKGRNDVDDNIPQENRGDTQNDDTLSPDRPEKYY